MVDNNNNNHKKNRKRWSERVKKASTVISNSFKKAAHFIIKIIKESLLFAIVRACLLIFVLIYIIFTIKPRQAHVSINISELGYPFYYAFGYPTIEMFVGAVFFDSLDEYEIQFFSKSAFFIGLQKYEIEGLPLPDNGNYELVIFPEVHDLSREAVFSMTGEIKDVYFSRSSSTDLHLVSTKSLLCNSEGTLNLQIMSGRAVIVKSRKEKVADIDSDSINLIRKTDNSSATEYRSRDFYWDYYSVPHYFNLGSESNVYSEEDLQNPHLMEEEFDAILKYNSGKFSIESISSLKAVTTGKLSLSFTPTPQEYDLIKQDLSLVGQNLNLECNVVYDADDNSYKTEGVLYGYITDGEISEISLFPSFETWFFSNAYMTPTAIITIILTAIALFTKKRS